MQKRKQLLLFVTIALCYNFSCMSGSAQRETLQSENLKVAPVSETLKATKKNAVNTEPSAVGNSKIAETQKGDDQKSNCSRNIKGADSTKIEVPNELCFDEEKPADKSETVPNPPSGVRQANTLFDDTVTVSEVPAEVLQVIELIKGSKLTAKQFRLTVSPNGQDSTTPKRAIKMYLYSPITDGGEASGTFYFQKQKGKLKFVSADI